MDPFVQLMLNLARVVGYSGSLGTLGYAGYKIYLHVLLEWQKYQHIIKSYDLRRAMAEAKVAQSRILQLERSEDGLLGGLAFWKKNSNGQPTVIDLDTSRAILTKGELQEEMREVHQQLNALRLLMAAAGSQPKAMADVVQGAVELPPLLLPRHVSPAQLIEGQPVSIYRLPLAMMVNEQSREYEVLYGDARAIYHGLITGRTRMGKSTLLEWITFLYATAVEQCEIVLIDACGVGTFDAFRGCSRLRYPVIREDGDYFSVMADLEEEMRRRRAAYEAYGETMQAEGHPKPGVRSLEMWNMYYRATPERQFVPIFVNVDEATMMFEDKRVVTSMMRLARAGGKYGIRILLAGTDFKWDTFPTQARAMFSTRFACAVDGVLSGPLLGTRAAEDLQAPGEFIARLAGQTTLYHCQGAELTEDHMRMIPRGDPGSTLEQVVVSHPTAMLARDRPDWQTPEAAMQIVQGFIHQMEQGRDINVTEVSEDVLRARGSTKWTWVAGIQKALMDVSLDGLDIEQFIRDTIFAVEGA